MHARRRLTSQAAAIFGAPGVVGVYDDGERTPRTQFERHQLLLQIGLRPTKGAAEGIKLSASFIHLEDAAREASMEGALSLRIPARA
jgi:hypothetical protein